MSGTKSPNLNASRLAWQLSLSNPLKPGTKPRIKMWLEHHRQAMLQLHLSDQQLYCLLRCLISEVWRYMICYWNVKLGDHSMLPFQYQNEIFVPKYELGPRFVSNFPSQFKSGCFSMCLNSWSLDHFVNHMPQQQCCGTMCITFTKTIFNWGWN